ncbi:hypothetical protein ykris0001_40900 [Yersinia kristensenii ATCC 33638]|nr:hypothetical protein ykris0001_40900 [Yersinia kristensenii ATCC 33638]
MKHPSARNKYLVGSHTMAKQKQPHKETVFIIATAHHHS